MSFSDYIQAHQPSRRELPLVHASECHRFNSIFQGNALGTNLCNVFKGEPLLYFFYGRPAFRSSSSGPPLRNISHCPICFVFRTGRQIPLKRMFPFDSGGSQPPYSFYEPHITAADALQKYELTGLLEDARRIVSAFFETEENYFRNRPRLGLAFTPGEVDAEAYYELITSGGNPNGDDRYSAIEVQTDQPVDLHGQLLALAMPESFLENMALMKVLEEDWHAFPLTYPDDQGLRPQEFHGLIRQLIRDHYKALKLM